MTERPIRVQLRRTKYWKQWRKSPTRPRAKCHPKRPHRARGLCDGCYGKWLYQNSPRHNASKKATGARWRSRNAVSLKVSNRNQKLRKLYGITDADYRRMLRKQGGKCALCDRSDLKLAVDHDHDTGRIRRLLCLPCNGALAWLEKIRRKASWIQRANRYLKEFS